MREKDKMYCIICDIDNVYTDSREWIAQCPKEGAGRAEWDEFQKLAYLAKPNKQVIDYLLSVKDLTPIMFVTSREDRRDQRKIAVQQIEEFSDNMFCVGENCYLYMRKEFDYRHSDVVKEDIVKGIVAEGWIPLLAIDDYDVNCEMFKKMGIPTNLYDIEKQEMIKYFEVPRDY